MEFIDDSDIVYGRLLNDHAIPFLDRMGFKRSRKELHERRRDDYANFVAFTHTKERSTGACIVSITLGITLCGVAELLAEHLDSKKLGTQYASVWTSLARVTSPHSSTPWTYLALDSDPDIIGSILVEQLEQAAMPFFEAHSSDDAILQSQGWEHPNDLYTHPPLLIAASMWLKGDTKAALEFLESKEKKYQEEYKVKYSLKIFEAVESMKRFREFLLVKIHGPDPF